MKSISDIIKSFYTYYVTALVTEFLNSQQNVHNGENIYSSDLEW
jgi:hypothetical protein